MSENFCILLKELQPTKKKKTFFNYSLFSYFEFQAIVLITSVSSFPGTQLQNIKTVTRLPGLRCRLITEFKGMFLAHFPMRGLSASLFLQFVTLQEVEASVRHLLYSQASGSSFWRGGGIYAMHLTLLGRLPIREEDDKG